MAHPNVAMTIVMGKTDFDAATHAQQSQVIVPVDTPGFRVERMLSVFGYDERPIGHAEVVLENVRVPVENLIAGEGGALAVSVQSFSYKRGLPRAVDMVFDCRFLRNPHWEPSLRPLDGRDPRVTAHVCEDPLFAAFFDRVRDLVTLLLPAYRDEGKAHLSIALGCSGGRHRSVAVAELLAPALAEGGWQVSIRHRELERRNESRTDEVRVG